MVVQTAAMAFWYNAPLTFQLLEASQMTITVFQKLLQVLSIVKKDFELRRLIFGLTAIVATPLQAMPAVVSQRLPDIARELASLCERMREERVKVLTDNEEHLRKEESKRVQNSDDEDEGFEEVSGSDSDGEDEDDEEAVLKKLSKFKKGEEDSDGDDSDDSDYEYMGGDLAIYDSALDEVDELIHVRDALERLNSADASYTQQLFSSTPAEAFVKF